MVIYCIVIAHLVKQTASSVIHILTENYELNLFPDLCHITMDHFSSQQCLLPINVSDPCHRMQTLRTGSPRSIMGQLSWLIWHFESLTTRWWLCIQHLMLYLKKHCDSSDVCCWESDWLIKYWWRSVTRWKMGGQKFLTKYIAIDILILGSCRQWWPFCKSH